MTKGPIVLKFLNVICQFDYLIVSEKFQSKQPARFIHPFSLQSLRSLFGAIVLRSPLNFSSSAIENKSALTSEWVFTTSRIAA